MAPNSQSTKRGTVVALLARDEVCALRFAGGLLEVILARKLQRGLNGFTAAANQERSCHLTASALDEQPGQVLGRCSAVE